MNTLWRVRRSRAEGSLEGILYAGARENLHRQITRYGSAGEKTRVPTDKMGALEWATTSNRRVKRELFLVCSIGKRQHVIVDG